MVNFSQIPQNPLNSPFFMPAPIFTVIVPLAPGESEWAGLLADLQPIPDDWEVVLAATDSPPDDFIPAPNLHWRQGGKNGRAAQMNAAAKESAADFLWFVHADARPARDAVAKLRESVARSPQALHYFPLRFRDGGGWMRVNEWGARFRRALFGNPWGDQSLCVSRATFEKVGMFPENAPYGEDNLFALRARRLGVPLRLVRADVSTSARGYGAGFGGWLRVTFRYQCLWIRQALAERKKGGGA